MVDDIRSFGKKKFRVRQTPLEKPIHNIGQVFESVR